MSLSPSPAPEIVSALRAAGCVFAEDEAELLVSTARTPDALAAMVQRRVDGLPLEHVLGWAEFCGLRIFVGPGVFVPRRRTEFLVERAVALAPPRARPVVVDLCCGSGAVGAALATALGDLELHASDVDPAAVRYARRNLAPAGGQVHEGDLFAALPTTLHGRVDVLTANVPYVPSDEVGLLPAEARDHEPRTALDGGADGLDVLRRVASQAAAWLAPGGVLLTEASDRQGTEAEAVLSAAGLDPRRWSSDELYATVVTGASASRS